MIDYLNKHLKDFVLFEQKNLDEKENLKLKYELRKNEKINLEKCLRTLFKRNLKVQC